MLDIKVIRENRKEVEGALKNRGASLNLDELLQLDEERKGLLQEVEQLKNKRNTASDEIGLLLREKKDATPKKEAMKVISQKIDDLDKKVGEITEKITYFMLRIPNIPQKSVPVGKDNTANKEIKRWRDPKKLPFKPKTHVELSEQLGIMDFKRAAKITGAAFPLACSRTSLW